MKRGLLILVAMVSFISVASESRAQFQDFARRSLLQNRRPTVSPYLNLVNSGGGAQNYFTLVRPALEQRQRNIQSDTRFRQLQQNLQAVSSRRAQPQQPQGIRPTGAPSTYLWYGNFYPRLSVRR